MDTHGTKEIDMTGYLDQHFPVETSVKRKNHLGVMFWLVFQFNFVSTWGDPYHMGLTGIELLGPNQESIPLSYSMLKVRYDAL